MSSQPPPREPEYWVCVYDNCYCEINTPDTFVTNPVFGPPTRISIRKCNVEIACYYLLVQRIIRKKHCS